MCHLGRFRQEFLCHEQCGHPSNTGGIHRRHLQIAGRQGLQPDSQCGVQPAGSSVERDSLRLVESVFCGNPAGGFFVKDTRKRLPCA